MLWQINSANGLALILFSDFFKNVPENASLAEEVSILEKSMKSNNPIKVKSTLNETQNDFRINRFCEIIKDNKDSSYFIKYNNKPIAERIMAVEAVGFLASSMYEKQTKSGHTVGELIADFQKIYLLQYKIYRENPEHSIFRNAILENFNSFKNEEQDTSKKSNNKGCLGTVLFFIVLMFSILFFI